MTVTCEWCGATTSETYVLSLEWPAAESEEVTDANADADAVEFDDPGEVTLAVCPDCADTVATNVLVDRAVTRDLDGIYTGLHPGEGSTATEVRSR